MFERSWFTRWRLFCNRSSRSATRIQQIGRLCGKLELRGESHDIELIVMAMRRRTKKQMLNMCDAIENKVFVLYSMGMMTMQSMDTVIKACERTRKNIKK